MQTTPRHRDVEARFRELLDGAGLAVPDRVEHRSTSVVFCWDGPRVAVVVDLEPDECHRWRADRPHECVLGALTEAEQRRLADLLRKLQVGLPPV